MISFDGFPIDKFVKPYTGPGRQLRTSANNKGNMKQFTIEVKHASGPQLQTIAAELKLMSHNWTKFGPRITINKRALEPLKLRLSRAEVASRKQETNKRHNYRV